MTTNSIASQNPAAAASKADDLLNRSPESDPANPEQDGSEAPNLGADMGKEDFLKLLVTQLRNQDPMSPMKGQEFAAQLAQFSSVEQLININETLASQQGGTSALSKNLKSGLASNMLGKTVRAEGNSITWAGNELDLRFTMQSPAAEATLTIRDAAGQVVRTEDLGALDGGPQSFTWDGTTNDGEAVAEGAYTYSIDAVNPDGEAVQATTFLSGTVDRITFGQDDVLLWVGDRSLPLDSVQSIEQP